MLYGAGLNIYPFFLCFFNSGKNEVDYLGIISVLSYIIGVSCCLINVRESEICFFLCIFKLLAISFFFLRGEFCFHYFFNPFIETLLYLILFKNIMFASI